MPLLSSLCLIQHSQSQQLDDGLQILTLLVPTARAPPESMIAALSNHMINSPMLLLSNHQLWQQVNGLAQVAFPEGSNGMPNCITIWNCTQAHVVI